MDRQDESTIEKRTIAFVAPSPLAEAIREAASKELCSQSDICRRALAADLRGRGLLGEEV